MLLMFGCNVKNNSIKEVSNPGYLAPAVPFKVNNYVECINIENLTGKVVFSLFVSSEGSLESFNVSLLELNTYKDYPVILYNNFTTKPISIDDYPDNVIYYYGKFENYLSNLEFVKKEQAQIDKVNQFFLMIRIGCK